MLFKCYWNLLKNVENWQKYFAVKHNPEKFFLMKGRNNVSFWVIEEILPIFKEIYMQDSYQIHFIKEKILIDRPIIVDIGANAGYAATFFFSYFPKARLLSFEPLAVNFELLVKNQKQNPVFDWLVVPKAVSKEKVTIALFYQKNRGLTPIASTKQDFDKNNQDYVLVESIALKNIFEEYQLHAINLLKIDCEGAEYEILYHTPPEYLAKIQMIAMETHQGTAPDENQQAMQKFLQNIGFQVKTSKEMLWAWRNDL